MEIEMDTLDETEGESHQQYDSSDSRRNSDGYLNMEPHENSEPESQNQQQPELADPLMSDLNGKIHKLYL